MAINGSELIILDQIDVGQTIVNMIHGADDELLLLLNDVENMIVTRIKFDSLPVIPPSSSTPTSSSSSSSSSSESSTLEASDDPKSTMGIIIGVIVGALSLCAIVGVIAFSIHRRQMKKQVAPLVDLEMLPPNSVDAASNHWGIPFSSIEMKHVLGSGKETVLFG